MDAVVAAHLRGLGAEFAECVAEGLGEERRLGDLAHASFSFWRGRLHVLGLLKENGLFDGGMHAFWEGVGDSLPGEGDAASLRYLYRFMAGGMTGMLDQRVEDGAERSPREMARLADRLAEHLSFGKAVGEAPFAR